MALSVAKGLSWNEDNFEPKPEPVIEHALLAEPITALRIWKVIKPEQLTLTREHLKRMGDAWARGDNPFAGLLGARLAAVAAGRTWEHTETAACNGSTMGYATGYATLSLSASAPPAPPHEAPARKCGCGVWAVKDEETLWQALNSYSRGEIMAYGQVQMWGRFYEHELGYRAQYARPVSLTVIDGADDVCRELADFYGCEVKSGAKPEAALKAAMTMTKVRYAGGLQQFIGTNIQAQAALSQHSWQTYMNSLTQTMLYGGPPMPAQKSRTHGSPSSFLASSRKWRDAKGIAAWEPGWFAVKEAA